MFPLKVAEDAVLVLCPGCEPPTADRLFLEPLVRRLAADALDALAGTAAVAGVLADRPEAPVTALMVDAASLILPYSS